MPFNDVDYNYVKCVINSKRFIYRIRDVIDMMMSDAVCEENIK